jgi:hypothetical protein
MIGIVAVFFIVCTLCATFYRMGKINGQHELLDRLMPDSIWKSANLDETQRLLKELRIAARNYSPKKGVPHDHVS